MIDTNKGLPWFIFFNNSTGKQLLLAQAFTNFHNMRCQGEVYWQKGFDIIQSRSYNTNN